MCRKAPLWQAAWPAQPHSGVEQGGRIWRSVFAPPSWILPPGRGETAGRSHLRLRLHSSPLNRGRSQGPPLGRSRWPNREAGRAVFSPPPWVFSPPPEGGGEKTAAARACPAAAMSGTTRRCGEVIPRILFRGLPGARARAASPARKPQPRQALGRPRPASGRKLSLGPWSGLRAAREPASFAEAAKGVRHGRTIVAQKQSVRGARARSGSDNPHVFKGLCRLVPARLPILRVGFRPFPSVSVRDSPG